MPLVPNQETGHATPQPLDEPLIHSKMVAELLLTGLSLVQIGVHSNQDTGPLWLDTLVRSAHRFHLGPWRPHPYLLMADVAIVAEIALAVAFSLYFEGFELWRFLIAFAVMQAGYAWGYRKIKLRVFGERARSFLQDTVIFILPAYLGASAALGLPMAASIDLAGLALPLGLGFMRLGCFFGGCCYGRPFAAGVWYDRDVLVPVEGWRRFTPGDRPGVRVFPVQLVEAAFCFAVFSVLGARLLLAGQPDGLALAWFLLSYAFFRFGIEPFRGHRHRPKYGPLSESQWVACALAVVAGAVIVGAGR